MGACVSVCAVCVLHIPGQLQSISLSGKVYKSTSGSNFNYGGIPV